MLTLIRVVHTYNITTSLYLIITCVGYHPLITDSAGELPIKLAMLGCHDTDRYAPAIGGLGNRHRAILESQGNCVSQGQIQNIRKWGSGYAFSRTHAQRFFPFMKFGGPPQGWGWGADPQDVPPPPPLDPPLSVLVFDTKHVRYVPPRLVVNWLALCSSYGKMSKFKGHNKHSDHIGKKNSS